MPQPRSARACSLPRIGVALALYVTSGPACYECTIQGRFLEFRAADSAGTVTSEAFVELDETRGSEEGQYILWAVREDPTSGPVSAVRLRAGMPDDPGMVLYDFPLLNAVPSAGVITQVFQLHPYAGATPFLELWDRLQHEPFYVEIVYEGSLAPRGIGPLHLTNEADWRDILCT